MVEFRLSNGQVDNFTRPSGSSGILRHGTLQRKKRCVRSSTFSQRSTEHLGWNGTMIAFHAAGIAKVLIDRETGQLYGFRTTRALSPELRA